MLHPVDEVCTLQRELVLKLVDVGGETVEADLILAEELAVDSEAAVGEGLDACGVDGKREHPGEKREGKSRGDHLDE